jgi:Cu/Ag efflux protein CusF
MRDCKRFHTKRFLFLAIIVAGISFSIGLAGCSSPKPAEQPAQGPQKYALTGRVVSVDKDKKQVTVDADDIPGFMMAMTMGYAVKNPSMLDPLSPEDKIKADVMVNGDDVWLENIAVVKKADQAKTPASNTAQPGSPQSKP